MRFLLAAAAATLAAAQTCNSPIVSGQVPVLVNGFTQPWSLVASGGSTNGLVVNSDGSFTVLHGYRGYLVHGCPQKFTGDMYALAFSMVGTQLNFTVDLSTSGCACNAAFYAVAMPAYAPDNKTDPTSCGDYYCDANDVCGRWCVEMDIMEANTAAMQITPHKCDTPIGPYYPSCDKSGCGLNTYRNAGAGAYGPGSNYTIDTTKPFTVSTTFTEGTGGLVAVSTILSQPGAGRAVTLTHNDGTCGNGYLESMTTAMAAGMVPTFSVWGDSGPTMKWLDEPPCDPNASCDDSKSTMVISAISLTRLS